MSEPDSHDIHEAAVTLRPAFEPSGLERERILPNMFKLRGNVFGGARPPELREWRSREKTQQAPISVLRKSEEDDAFQYAHFTDGETEA